MTPGLVDTTVFVARESGRPLDAENVPEELAVSVITIGELRAAVLAAEDVETRHRRPATAMALRVPIVTQDEDYVDVPSLTVISV